MFVICFYLSFIHSFLEYNFVCSVLFSRQTSEYKLIYIVNPLPHTETWLVLNEIFFREEHNNYSNNENLFLKGLKTFRKKRKCWVTAFTPFASILTHYQMTNFRLFQTEGVCKRQFQIRQKWQKVIQMGRKHCGKRRNCSSRAISPFPTVFSKDLYCRHVKTRACLGKG